MSFIGTERGTPALSRFLTAVRLKSWKRRPGTPAALQAASVMARWAEDAGHAVLIQHGRNSPEMAWLLGELAYLIIENLSVLETVAAGKNIEWTPRRPW